MITAIPFYIRKFFMIGRVLRPIKNINLIPPLKRFSYGIFHSFAGLIKVLIFYVFILYFFSVIGLYLFKGRFFNK